jgi:hypothetical protein
MMPAVRAVVAPRRLLAVVLAGALALGGCESSQDPGLDPGVGTGGPAPTSDTLPDCPPGGPDATTPPAGCLGSDGRVLHP